MGEIDFGKMLSLYGNWEPEGNHRTKYVSSTEKDSSHGLALLSNSVKDGIIECDITIPQTGLGCGAFVLFRANGQTEYFGAGLGGWDAAYSLFEGKHLSASRIVHAGNINNLVSGRVYRIRIILDGQRVQLLIDGVKVLDYDRLPTSGGTGLGLFAFRSTTEALFGPLTIDDRRPNAFIAMQFSDLYNEVYRDAIRPLVEEIGYEPVRVDEVSGPGIILNDIWSHLTEASVVIAEVSEANPNVYYEIGVAHALQKPTVLLAQRHTKLPFDLGPHRCIFYDNSIAGRSRLLDALRSSLSSVLSLPSGRAA